MDETTKPEHPYQVVPANQLPPVVSRPSGTERKSFTEQIGLAELVKASGMLQLSNAQKEILYADFDPALVEIKGDGIIYLPWVFYSQRLFKAFGMEWALIPLDPPVVKGNLVAVHYGLVIKGAYIADAWGDAKYWPTNPVMTYTDCVEGAKSDCLRRLCKAMGIGLSLWEPEYIRSWKEKYAEEYQSQGKTKWRKRKEAPKNVKTPGAGENVPNDGSAAIPGPPGATDGLKPVPHGPEAGPSATKPVPSGGGTGEKKETRLFSPDVQELVKGAEFQEWAKVHACHNMKDIKDMLEVFYDVTDLRTITLEQVHDWMVYLEDTDLGAMSKEGQDAIGRGSDSGTGGSTDKLDGGSSQGELREE